ncbi:MAG: hypothetical protein Q9170_000861 [Blastenia crenularia]
MDQSPRVIGDDGDGGLALRSASLSVDSVDELKELLPRSRFNPSSMESVFSKKKKVVMPAVDMSRMTTVQEGCQDSPTIPGRPPLLERSMSVPTVVSLRRLSEEPSQTTPRASEFARSQMDQDVHAGLQAPNSESKLTKRASVLMARELAPLIIPMVSPKDQRPDHSVLLDHGRGGVALPPRVPPKSPRTESRASPRAGRAQHSSHSSISTSHSAASSASSLSNPSGRASPRLLSGPRRTDSHVSRASPKGTVDNVSPESIWSKLFRLESPSRQKKCMDIAEKQSPRRAEVAPTPTPSLSHQRWTSEASATTRGRLMRKESLAFRNHSKTTVRSPSSGKRDQDLPTGFKATEAPRQVADLELRSLRQQADEQVSNFEVLQVKDVSMLSKVHFLIDGRRLSLTEVGAASTR